MKDSVLVEKNEGLGFWYPARILTKGTSPTTTYSVEYDDGDDDDTRIEHEVPEDRIRLLGLHPKPSVITFTKEDKVEVNWQGHWYQGTVTRERADGTYDVQFADTNQTESRVQEKFIRLREGIDETVVPSDSSLFCRNGHPMVRSAYHKGIYESGYVW